MEKVNIVHIFLFPMQYMDMDKVSSQQMFHNAYYKYTR